MTTPDVVFPAESELPHAGARYVDPTRPFVRIYYCPDCGAVGAVAREDTDSLILSLIAIIGAWIHGGGTAARYSSIMDRVRRELGPPPNSPGFAETFDGLLADFGLALARVDSEGES